MKKAVFISLLLILLLGMVAGATGCGSKFGDSLNAGPSDDPPPSPELTPPPSDSPPSPDPTPPPSPSPEVTPPPAETEPPDNESVLFPDNPDLEYADLAGLEFWFCSGAGAWSTIVTIQSDGSFIGYYHDSDSGSMIECHFSGQFSPLVRTGDYEYSMKCKSLTMEGTAGETWIEDGITITTVAEAYGFDDADEFALYLPGKKMSELSEAYAQWAHGPRTDYQVDGVLADYGLYNIGGKQGFIVYRY